MKRLLVVFVAVLTVASAITAVALAGRGPDRIELPDGFRPEGIAAGKGQSVYVGSIPTGRVLEIDTKTGASREAVPARGEHAAIGLKYDKREDRLFVSGGPTGKAFVYDARDGDDLAEYTLAPPGNTFINDVVVTPRGAFFTDSRAGALSVVPLDDDGDLPGQDEVRSLPLTGDFQPVTGPDAFNLNGITSNLSGSRLIAVQSATGKLFLIDSSTGATDEIEVAGVPSFTAGDGLLLRGRRLYVVQNRLNQVSVVQLSQDLDEAKGTLLRVITDPALRVPTTIARSGSRYYVVNARFGTPVTTDTDYDVVRLPGR